MLRVRCRAALCVRDLTRRKLGGARTAAVRVLADSGQQAPPTGWIEHGRSFHTASSPAAATAGAAPVPADGDSVQLGTDGPEATLESSESCRAESELPTESHQQQPTPEEELVSKLKAIRSGVGPGFLEQAMQTLVKARKEGVYDITAYNVVIKMIGMEQWVSKEMVAMVEDLLVKLREDDLVPNIYTYNGVLFMYAQARLLPKTERVYKEMLSNGIEPNVVTLSHLLMAQAWGSSENMYRTLEEMDEKGWTPTRAAHLCAVAFMWQRKDTKGVLEMMQRMLERNFQPTESVFAMALMSAGRLGRADFAKVLFEWRHASGLGPKQEIYSSMMLAHSKADLHEESLGYWRQLVCLDGVGQVAIDPPTCESALKSAVVSNQWDEVETIADMLKDRTPAAAQHTYMLAIAACNRRSGGDRPDYSDRVERVVETLRRRMGTGPSPEVMCRVAMAYVHGHKWEKAAYIFEQTLAQDVEMWAFRWECVIQTLFALERFSDVKDTWTRSNTERGDQHTVRGNELAMRAAHRLQDGDWAKEIMALPANNNSKKGLNPATLLIAVEVLAETGRLGEARELLKDWKPSTTTRINHVNFNELLLCCERHGGSDVLLEFYQMLRKHDPLSRLRPQTFALVARAFCEHGRVGEVVSFFEEQLAAGYRPEKACYEAVARGASEAGDGEASVKFLEAAENLPAESQEEDAFVEFAEGRPELRVDSAGHVGLAGGGGGGGEDGTDVQQRDRPTPTTAGRIGEEGSPAAAAAAAPRESV